MLSSFEQWSTIREEPMNETKSYGISEQKWKFYLGLWMMGAG